MRSLFKAQMHNKLLFLAASALAGPTAFAEFYLENGVECRDERPTISVGDLVEADTNFDQVLPRGPHIYFYSRVVQRLIKLRLHKAGEWLPIKAERLDGDVYVADVPNDFKQRFRYVVKPVEGDLQLEVWSENLETMLLREVFKNCAPTQISLR